ncbi:unnamed protein product [Aphanomyces euteiches]|uniref:DFDF domain-containing protein n=1 Tax=Aphanomyces euteiches TaxID=100861 RepID=A0A6G0WU98_9STRA|nr:hypothetical protein Ae201684_011649 [Aphanomyces euteiches]KAH9097095.1 hypothetical protein Ae201684P_011824 [Aphanomyces euteiches]KAH9117878.1 hypothetical protein LEN26_012383 [Aphanomyces euteiches]KAH9129325.1 hypothetical protein AeMF1_000611 [Aphanomyces euteiches]KAH9151833.1 hypothetical protein AeRB84_005654 [Aphanomyces euteiches]
MSGDQAPGGVPYIGSRISLISKTDIRYEGLLFNIDTRQSMVALQNVRSFGTEGRRPDHIPPSDTVLQYATFKASEIKDLHVCEAATAPPLPPKQMPPPPPPQAVPPSARMPPPPPPQVAAPPLPQAHRAPPLPKQPASHPAPPQYNQIPPPLPTAPRPVSPKNTPVPPTPPIATSSTLLTPGAMSATNLHSPSVQVDKREHKPSPRHTDQPLQQESSYVNPPAQSNSRTIPGMGGHLLKRKERRVNSENGQPDIAGGEFDFAGGLHDFDKEKEFSKLTIEESSRPVFKGSYQKSSFFDTISCDALDRLEGNNGRMKAHEERKLNTETFGAVGLNNRRSYRGGRSRGGNGSRNSDRNDRTERSDRNDRNDRGANQNGQPRNNGGGNRNRNNHQGRDRNGNRNNRQGHGDVVQTD